MPLTDALLPEFDHEMGGVRTLLALVPDERLDWRAAESFNTIGWVATHLATIPGWVEGIIHADAWDVAAEDASPTPAGDTAAAIVERFDQNFAAAREALAAADDATLAKPWSLKRGDRALLTLPKAAVVRSWVLNHTIHHRAHLSVYLRMCGIEVPPMYGVG